MKKVMHFPALFLILISYPAVASSNYSFNVSSLTYSDAFTIHGLLNELEGDFQNGTAAFSFNQAEVSYQQGSIGFSIFVRNDYVSDFTADTAMLMYQGENNLPLTNNTNYSLQLSMNHLRAEGFGVSYTFKHSDTLMITPRLNLLHATDLIDGSLRGSISTSSDGKYSGNAALDYHYGEDTLLGREVSKPSDYGYSFDFDINWQLNEQLNLSLSVKDLLGYIHWDKAPVTIATVTSVNEALSDDGFLNVKPALKGVEGFSKYKQKIPTRYHFIADYEYTKNLYYSAEVFVVEDLVFPRLSLRWETGSYTLTSTIDIKTKAAGLSIGNDTCKASVLTDDISMDKAHMLGLSFGCNILF